MRFFLACLNRRLLSRSNINISPAVGTSGKEKDDTRSFDALIGRDDTESVVLCSITRDDFSITLDG